MVYYVTGVAANYGGLETAFTCTNMEKLKLVYIGVEIFNVYGYLLNDIHANNGTTGIFPAETATIATAHIQALIPSSIMTGPITVENGSARIVSTSPRILCSAGLWDKTNAPPTSMMQLPVFKGNIEKGN